VITEDLGIKLENVTIADLGTAKRVIVDKETRRSSKAAATESDPGPRGNDTQPDRRNDV
jgi:chaperonin GroEL